MSHYKGRFAPSPTGPLHFGSLLAALASYIDARHAGGSWLLRIEDVDEQRAVPGAADAQLRLLEAYGFTWDGEVLVQSTRKARYRAVTEALISMGDVFACQCSRKEVARNSHIQGLEGPVYAGTCRGRNLPEKANHALRLVVNETEIAFNDRIADIQRQCLATQVGDFVIRRADGFFAYQLASVIDDADQGITDIVRGSDLLISTPRQIHLHQLLGNPPPTFAHIPLALNSQGRKLSKQDDALPVRINQALATLICAWNFLNQQPVPEEIDSLDGFWNWAIPHWRVTKIGCRPRRPEPPK